MCVREKKDEEEFVRIINHAEKNIYPYNISNVITIYWTASKLPINSKECTIYYTVYRRIKNRFFENCILRVETVLHSGQVEYICSLFYCQKKKKDLFNVIC
jgi:hypothetical protein